MLLNLILIFIFIFGLIIGSFLNCLIWRLHKGENLWGRSYCPKCRKKIAWCDNIPVFSFLALGGECRHCYKQISWQYPTVELITGVLFLASFVFNLQLVGYSQELNFQFSIFNFQSIGNFKFLILNLRDWFIIAIMTVIFIYDLRWYLILDIVTLPACLLIFLFNLYLGISWQNLAISGIIGSSFFLLQFIISRGKWIGGGDIRLGLLLGIIFGWPLVLLAIFLGYFIGSIIGVYLIIVGKKGLKSEVPLGVFLSVSAVITLFWGEKILAWYLKFL